MSGERFLGVPIRLEKLFKKIQECIPLIANLRRQASPLAIRFKFGTGIKALGEKSICYRLHTAVEGRGIGDGSTCIKEALHELSPGNDLQGMALDDVFDFVGQYRSQFLVIRDAIIEASCYKHVATGCGISVDRIGIQNAKSKI